MTENTDSEGAAKATKQATLKNIKLLGILVALAGCMTLSSDPQERERSHEFMEHHMEALK